MRVRYGASLLGVVAAVLLSTLGVGRAGADESGGPSSDAPHYPRHHVHASLAAGRAVGEPYATETSWGGQGALSYELRLVPAFGLELGVNAYALSDGSAPQSPLVTRVPGFEVDGALGVRVRPNDHVWLYAAGGVGESGSTTYGVMQARVGVDAPIFRAKEDLRVGPFFGYTHLFTPSSAARPDDANLLWLGLQLDFDFTPRYVAPPRPDADRDGIPDDVDACPTVPGVRATTAHTNGCPAPRADRDADGIPDEEDKCPNVQGSVTGDARHGCRVAAADRDHDGIPDREDACPDLAGVHSYVAAMNGCPEPPDRDHDGVLDADDACPIVPGLHTDVVKTNGCPPPGRDVRVEGDQIVLDEVIYFDFGSPRVRHVSWPIVKKVAEFIVATPDIEEVLIEGHADAVGETAYNVYVSRERAIAVQRLLMQNGVPEAMLKPRAFGADRPVKPGKDEGARRENRRVEFTITHARVLPAPDPLPHR